MIDLWSPPQEIRLAGGKVCFSVREQAVMEWHSGNTPPAGAVRMAADSGIIIRHVPIKDRFRFFIGCTPQDKCSRLGYLGLQGYSLQVNDDGIIAEANSNTGLFYALVTLRSLLKSGPTVPVLEIIDRPNSDHRGIMIDLARVVESPDFIISLLPFLAECKLNQIYLYLENKLQLKSHPQLAHPCAWTREEVKRLVTEAADYCIDIIPMLATIGHMESILKHPDYRHLAVSGSGDHLETDNPESKKFIAEVIDEICSLFPSEYVHLAGDECPYLGQDAGHTVRKYAEFMNFMTECLSKYGKRGIIWADMVEKYPELKSTLPKNLVLTVWKYGPMDDMPMPLPEEFVKAGFDTALAPAILADEPFLPTVERLTRNIPYLLRRTGMWGIINCIWEPRTQNLPVAKLGMAIAGAYSWMPFSQTDELIRRASLFTYGTDISGLYELLEGAEFFRFMVKSRFGYYHAFELTCNNPLIHVKRKDPDEWVALSARLHCGYELLKKQDSLHLKHPVDYATFEACAALAIVLADCVVLMNKVGQEINNGISVDKLKSLVRELRDFSGFIELTLKLQRQAWDYCRRSEDENFRWWFEDPLIFKQKCLNSLANELEKNISKGSICLADHKFFSFKFHKGDAPEWNLWRVKILFSENGHEWQQVFFRTVPLWMSDGVTLELMPESDLPQHVRIESCYATWHRQSGIWSDMLKIRIGEIMPGCGRVYEHIPFVLAEMEYEIEYSAQCIKLSKRLKPDPV
jgi:hypothetical protein